MRDDQQELRGTAARLKAVLDGALDGIIAIDEIGVVQSINPAAVKLFGYPSEEVVGQNVKMLMPEPYRSSHDGYISHYLETGEAQIIGIGREVVGQRKDGSTFPMELGISEVRVESDPIFIGVVRDITERKRADQRTKLLLAEVNHRAKNLLAVVQAVARQTANKSEPRLFAKTFGERMAGLAASHDLLVRSEWDGVDIGDLARSQLAHFTGLIGKRIHLYGPKVQITPAAAQAIGMALHELATNAVKHGALSNSEGSIHVDWSIGGDPTKFRMSWSEQGGPAVAPPKHSGFGGIVLVNMIKHTLGAQVSLSFPSTGLVWRMEAPVERVCPQLSQTEPAPPPSRRAPMRVLIVEDEFIIAMDTEAVLEDAGCEVGGVAATLEEAQQLIDKNGWDAAVLDANLNGVSAEPVAERLRQRGVPFIVMSGYTADHMAGALAQAPFLPKPAEPSSLVSAVRSLQK